MTFEPVPTASWSSTYRKMMRWGGMSKLLGFSLFLMIQFGHPVGSQAITVGTAHPYLDVSLVNVDYSSELANALGGEMAALRTAQDLQRSVNAYILDGNWQFAHVNFVLYPYIEARYVPETVEVKRTDPDTLQDYLDEEIQWVKKDALTGYRVEYFIRSGMGGEPKKRDYFNGKAAIYPGQILDAEARARDNLLILRFGDGKTWPAMLQPIYYDALFWACNVAECPPIYRAKKFPEKVQKKYEEHYQRFLKFQ